MMDKEINICFAGCGDHANRFIYPSLANVPGARLKAVCALEASQAARTMKKYGAEASYSDFREMIEKEKPDAAIIVGPPRFHYEAGKFCLENKIPFFIEKPPGENLAQATELAELSDKHGTFGQVGFMMRHSSVVKKAREIANAQNLGKIHYGSVKYYTSGPYRSDEIYGMPGADDMSFLWRYLMLQGVHPVNLAASFLGDISSIEPEVIFSGENILANIRLKDSSGSFFDVILHTFVAPGYGNLEFKTELIMDKRAVIDTDNFSTLNYYAPEPIADFLEGNNKNRAVWDFSTFGNNNEKMGYETEIAAFVDSVRAGAPTETNLKDAMKTMKILTKAFETTRNRGLK